MINELIIGIALICLTSTGAFNNDVDKVLEEQKKCQKYYATCMSNFVDKLVVIREERMIKCIKERK